MSQVKEILEQRDCGLISTAEARAMLATLSKQAQFNAAYADDPNEYFRWTRVTDAARAALHRS